MLGLRSPALRSHCAARRPMLVAPKMQGGEEGKVVWDAGSDWKSESQKLKEATSGMQMRDQSGNVDTPDYFDDGEGGVATAGDTGFTSGAAATGGDQKSKLQSMLSADKTEVRAVEKFKSDQEVKFVAHKWKIDGDFASGDPTFDLKWSAAFQNAESTFEVRHARVPRQWHKMR